MADEKISALSAFPAAALTGAEIFPAYQSGATDTVGVLASQIKTYAGVPNGVAVGDVLTDNGPGVAATFQAPASQSGRLISTRAVPIIYTYTGSGSTYTPSPGVNSIYVVCIGDGGGGAGAGYTSLGSVGGGGGSGGWTSGFFSLAPLVGAITVTVGSGGAGGAAGFNAGGTGTGSSIQAATSGTMLACNGGSGAPAPSDGTYLGRSGAGGSVPTPGTLLSMGNQGGIGFKIASANLAQGGLGGGTPWGAGGNGGTSVSTGQAGGTTNGYGGGGGGGCANSVAFAGGRGGTGAILIWEYS